MYSIRILYDSNWLRQVQCVCVHCTDRNPFRQLRCRVSRRHCMGCMRCQTKTCFGE
jgi:hypothetical protein